MIMWLLFIIVLDTDRYYVKPEGFFPTMQECFEARDRIISAFPQPKINYEIVCIQSDTVRVQ